MVTNQSSPTSSPRGGAVRGGYNLIYRYPTASAAGTALKAYDAVLGSSGYSEEMSTSTANTVLQSWASSSWKLAVTVGPTGNSPASELSLIVSSASTQG
jgi:hypothetical protein